MSEHEQDFCGKAQILSTHELYMQSAFIIQNEPVGFGILDMDEIENMSLDNTVFVFLAEMQAVFEGPKIPMNSGKQLPHVCGVSKQGDRFND